MEPELTKSAAKIEKSALNRPKWLPDGSQDPLDQCPSPIFASFGVSSGTPKSTKNQFLAKQGAPRNAFLPVWWQMLWFLIFWWIFGRFLMRFQCKNRCMFLHQLVFFSNWRHSQNTVFYNAKPTFSFFVSIFFF